MSDGSFYFRDNPAFKGGSPQAVYEELWERGRKQRLIQRGIVAAALFVLGAKLLSPAWGLLLGIAGAGAATVWQWWLRAMHTVWLHGRRGERRTAGILRFTLEPRGYRVLHGRSVPGYGNLDHLVIGPTGIWAISNQAWGPDTEFSTYGGRLFVGKELGTPEITKLAGAAATVSGLVTARLKATARPVATEEITAPPQVSVAPLLTVYGGKLPRGTVSEGVLLARSYQVPRRIRRASPGRRLTREEIDDLTQAAIHALPIGDHTMAAR